MQFDITVAEAVEQLDKLPAGDREVAHYEADKIILKFVPDEVAAAYRNARNHIGFWYA